MIRVKKCDTTGFEPGKSCPGFLYVTLHCWPCYQQESAKDVLSASADCGLLREDGRDGMEKMRFVGGQGAQFFLLVLAQMAALSVK